MSTCCDRYENKMEDTYPAVGFIDEIIECTNVEQIRNVLKVMFLLDFHVFGYTRDEWLMVLDFAVERQDHLEMLKTSSKSSGNRKRAARRKQLC